MDNLSLFTLLLACATFLLAGAASWTIWQNYKFREKDRKERLLNEIIEWAIDVYECGIKDKDKVTMDFVSRYLCSTYRVKEDLDSGMRLIECSELGDIYTDFSVLQGRGQYSVEISNTIFKQHLNFKTSVNKLYSDTKDHMEIVNRYYKEMSEDINNVKWDTNEHIDDIHNHRQQIYSSAVKVIEEATKFKTENLN
jgi:hypothetical protein